MDENYFKRITYGTPENISIRRFYNQLQNRPVNCGMENLFSETTSNINQITTPYHNTSFNNMPQYSQNRSFEQEMKDFIQETYTEYSQPRNYQNRYYSNCHADDILYNIVSNYKISPNAKIINSNNTLIDAPTNYLISKIPIIGDLFKGNKIGNGIANVYNALYEAGCFKK